jgi:hypothetical protein
MNNVETTVVVLNELFSTYKDNPYMLSRLQMYLTNLPTMLEQENAKHEEKVSRINCLLSEQHNFNKVFLSKHQYYYMPFNNIYYEYDGKNYKIIKDDDIHYHLLTTITEEGKLVQWKHKTKQTIIKKIKERSLFKSVPETYTIQNVLGFLGTIFQCKTEAKHFLTVIGDCILKKNNDNLLFFVNSHTKKIISLIDSITYITTGVSIMNNFISKYHANHKLCSYRLITTNEISNTFSFDIIKDVLNNIGIDLLCVAFHYSDRYTNSDTYLYTKAENNVKTHILHLKNNTLDDIIKEFIMQCIEHIVPNSGHIIQCGEPNVVSDIAINLDTVICWKNMHYIWKLYLTSINIPNMIYATNLQQLLSQQMDNITENGIIYFTNVTSKFLPRVSSFLNFWEKYISISIGNEKFDDEFEIDELSSLFKQSGSQLNVSDTEIIKMICHYFSPQVEVIDNKYVANISCNLWSKQDDSNEFLMYYKHKLLNDLLNVEINADLELISFDELYQNYKKYFKAKNVVEQKNLPIVSKHFFEKFVSYKLADYIRFEKFVSYEWLHA